MVDEITSREFDLLVRTHDRLEHRLDDLITRCEEADRRDEERDKQLAILLVKYEAADESFKTWTRATATGIVALIFTSVGSLIWAKGGF